MRVLGPTRFIRRFDHNSITADPFTQQNCSAFRAEQMRGVQGFADGLQKDQSLMTRLLRRVGFSDRTRTAIFSDSGAERHDQAQKPMAKTSAVAKMIMFGPR